MKIPPHKVVGDVGKPGQIVNRPTPTASFDRYPYLKHSTADSGDQTLGDYLARKKRYEALGSLQPLAEAPKKLTFEDWYKPEFAVTEDEYARLRICWKAAQENV